MILPKKKVAVAYGRCDWPQAFSQVVLTLVKDL